MYPAHNITVLQLSVQSSLRPAHHLKLGQAIARLRAENVLTNGSGPLNHNLARLRRGAPDALPPADVAAFADWTHEALVQRRVDEVLADRCTAPYAVLQHPTEEHLLALFVAVAAAGENAAATRLHAPRPTTHCAWMPTRSGNATGAPRPDVARDAPPRVC